MLIKKGLLLAAAGLLTVTSRDVPKVERPSTPGGTVALAPRPDAPVYGPNQLEYYLTQDQLDFLRPGLNVSIVGVTNVAANQQPVVELLFTDDLGGPVDRKGIETPGPIEAEFILGQWDATGYDYVNLTTVSFGPATLPLHDVGGTWQDIETGHSKYTFKKALPADLNVTKTMTLGIYSSRHAKDFGGKDYNAPAALSTFRPDGGTATPVFAAIDTSSCNNCHSPISMHEQFGPPVQDVKLCVMCHTSQMPATVTGESLFFKVLIHKIHRGENLPSVQAGNPYIVSPGNDFSTVALPQDIRNCSTCHTPKAADGANWYVRPARAACGSCHDDINWVTGANHPAGAQADDSQCAACHAPQGNSEWDASITGAHTVPDKSKQLPGLNAEIVHVTQVAPGQSPTVTFKLTNGDGSPVDPAHIGNSPSLSLVLAGPTTDYGKGQAAPAQPISESAIGATFDGSLATYTFTKPIPASATGTWAVAVQTRRTINLSPAPKKGPTTFTEGPANNAVTYVAVTDGTPVPRRSVVALSTCNKCHNRLATTFSHGGQRISIEYCVFCHNPNGDDSGRRPADANPPESINFKRMIHRIHTGENLTQPYTIYGFGTPPSVNTFNDVRYPGNRKNCLQCHTSTDTYSLPLATGTIPTITQRDYFSPQGAATAACLGCHDNQDAAAHAFLNTVMAPFFGEACATCHGTGKDWDVVKVHAR